MGDDYRTSLLLGNLSASYLIAGDIAEAIAHGEESLTVGKQAPAQPALLRTLSNLAHAYLLAGKIDKAKECFDSWQRWIQNGRSWASIVEYYWETASLHLVFGNTSEALKLVAQADRDLQGKGYLFIGQGVLERMKVFLAYHAAGPEAARSLATQFMGQFKNRHLLAYLDAVAALAWVERQSTGGYSDATRRELALFEKYDVRGKRRVLVAQGFLE
jgi:tetratricopeptide (TPR) repeat protein